MVPPNAFNPHEPRPVGHCTMVIIHGNGTPKVHDLGLMHPLEAQKLALHCQGGVAMGDRLSPSLSLGAIGDLLAAINQG